MNIFVSLFMVVLDELFFFLFYALWNVFCQFLLCYIKIAKCFWKLGFFNHFSLVALSVQGFFTSFFFPLSTFLPLQWSCMLFAAPLAFGRGREGRKDDAWCTAAICPVPLWLSFNGFSSSPSFPPCTALICLKMFFKNPWWPSLTKDLGTLKCSRISVGKNQRFRSCRCGWEQ